MKLNCPIRGLLNVNDKAKDGITFTEEKRRIDLVKFLLSRNYDSNLFGFEINVWDIGNSGRNHLRSDLVIYNSDNKKVNNIKIVAEVKRDNKDKDDAINQQLKPACLKTNCDYGIYYDGVENIFFTKEDNYEEEHPLSQFPQSGFSFEQIPLIYDNLESIKNINDIIKNLNQILYNEGLSKEARYSELFKIIQAKYYDEKSKIGTEDALEFQVSEDTVSRIQNLYSDSKDYYSNNDLSGILLKDRTIVLIVKLLQSYAFTKSKQDILQRLFMEFAQSKLKVELDQYYTPIDIVEFIISLVKIKNTTKVIDPAGGSADFLVGALKKNYLICENLHYWDSDKNATEVAKLNMILNGDGRTNIKTQDTIEKYNDMNNSFDLVITNPPFGDKTIFQGSTEILNKYNLFKDYNYKQLGVLYIERCMNLLKNNGNLIIILPNGYLNNPDDYGIREFLLKKYRIIGYISLPENTFKCSGAHVKPGILIVKKCTPSLNYPIFTDVALNIGYDFNSKKADRIYVKNSDDGSFMLDENNEKIVKSDFPIIASRFKKFAFDNNIAGFEAEDNGCSYETIYSKNVEENSIKLIRAETNTKEYKDFIDKCKNYGWVTLNDYNSFVELSNQKSIEISKDKEYRYIEISSLERGNYITENILMGWDLPNRAKQGAKKYDIFVGKLQGCSNKFCMVLNDSTDNLIFTNGCYRIRIKDEKIRLSFYRFLFTKEYRFQMESLSTGSLLLDIKPNDFLEKIYFPILTDVEIEKMKSFVEQQESFINYRNIF